jgi:hypothetical protein
MRWRVGHAAGLSLAALLAAASLAAATGGQLTKIDAERVLAERLGFSNAEVGQVRAGQAVTRLLPSREPVEVAVAGAVRITGTPARLVYWLKEIANFRKALELGTSARLSNPPQAGDFADLSLNAQELDDLKECRPGKCELRLGDPAIARFQSEVDWSAADAPRRANLLMRQLVLQLAQAYVKSGDVGLGTAHNEKTPRASADEFHALLAQASNLYELAPSLAAFIERFPAASLPGAEHFLYWGHGGAGPESTISLHQLIIAPMAGGGAAIVDKQLYSSRYTDAAIFVISLAPTADGSGYYAIIGARARARMLGGMSARLLRGRVESATRDTTKMYLTWLQGSMALAK